MKLECRSIYKRYDNLIANNNVNFTLRSGSVHALIGENGAGKTTLMKIISGEIDSDSGEILIDNEHIASNNNLLENVGMIHQHFELIDDFDVTENILFGQMPVKFKFLLDKNKAYDLVENFLQNNELKLNCRDKILSLSLADRCKVEIAKALYKGAKILIFDEPTTSFNDKEKKDLFLQFDKLSSQGFSIIFISHKLEEVMKVADDITIIESGKILDSFSAKDSDIDEISNLLFGQINEDIERKRNDKKKELLKIDGLSINSGEISSFLGLDKSGYDKIIKKLFKYCRKFNIKTSYIPEDRLKDGLIGEMSIIENLINVKKIDDYGRYILSDKKIKEYAEHQISSFDIKISNINHKVSELSGGNMQKVLIARELSYDAELILAVYPDRGLDKKTSAFILKKFIEKANENVAVIIITPNIEDAIKISDKIVVLLEDKINYSIDCPTNADIDIIKKKMIRS